MLMDGAAADRLSAIPKIRRIINNRETATPENMCEVSEWLTEEFPGKIRRQCRTEHTVGNPEIRAEIEGRPG